MPACNVVLEQIKLALFVKAEDGEVILINTRNSRAASALYGSTLSGWMWILCLPPTVREL